MRRQLIVKTVTTATTAFLCAALCGAAQAKLPPPSDEAKAKAEEAKAKAAHGDKLAAFQLCKAMDLVAQRYLKDNKGKGGKPMDTPPCQDPGPFQMVSAAPAAAAPPAPAAAAPAKKP